MAVFQRGTFAPVERGTGRASILPPAPLVSEPPAKDVLRATLLRDFQDKVEALEELHRALATANHYGLLGIPSTASPKDVRNAYSSVTKRFHLDAYFRQNIGEHKEQLDAVVSALTQAYETLRRPRTRCAYDESLGLLPDGRRFSVAADGSIIANPIDHEQGDGSRHHFNAIVPPRPPGASTPSVRPGAPQPSIRPGPSPSEHTPVRASIAPRPSAVVDTNLSTRPRERASRAAHAEREAFTEDEPKSGSTSFSGSASMRISFSPPPSTSAAAPSLLELAHQRRLGGGLSAWTAARLRDANQAEQAGLLNEAFNILRSVLNQVKDPHIAAHAARLQRLCE